MPNKSRAELRVFLASPSELAPEREIARAAVDRINRKFGSLIGGVVELLAWEDRSAGYGRPQALINEDVDSCDLFVGIVWRTFGTPTGTHASGFEEEFQRALARREETLTPEMWLYFKKVDDAVIADPGSQLRRVLDFRGQIQTDQKLLYRTFVTETDWDNEFFERLLQYSIKTLRKASPQLEVRSSADTANIPQLETATNQALTQLHTTIGRISQLFSRQDVGDVKDPVQELNRFEIARFYLVAATWMWRFGTYEPLHAHSTNLLFVYRRQIELGPWERSLLIRSMMVEGNQYIPGWFWLSERSDKVAEFFLTEMATGSEVPGVQIAALKLLQKCPAFKDTSNKADELVKTLVAKGSEDLISAVLSFAEICCSIDVIQQIGGLQNSSKKITDQVEETIQGILARRNPSEAIARLLMRPGSINWRALEKLCQQPTLWSREDLQKGIEHPNDTLRRFAASELSNRGDLTEDEAHSLLGDKSGPIRAVGIRHLIKIGKSLSPDRIRAVLKEIEQKGTLLTLLEPSVRPEEFIHELFETFTYEQLEKHADWLSIDAPIAYHVLTTLHTGRWSRVRSDLGDRFEGFYESYIQHLRGLLGGEAEQLITRMAEVKETIRTGFVEAGLRSLLAQPTPDDATFARAFLNSETYEIRLAAVRLLAKTGKADDSKVLVLLANDGYGSVSEEAAKAALVLSPLPEPIVLQFLNEGNHTLVRAALRWLNSASSSLGVTELEPFLYSDKDDIRVGIAKILVTRLTTEELESLVERYTNSGRYYYDVVVYFDRFLYAPSWIH